MLPYLLRQAPPLSMANPSPLMISPSPFDDKLLPLLWQAHLPFNDKSFPFDDQSLPLRWQTPPLWWYESFPFDYKPLPLKICCFPYFDVLLMMNPSSLFPINIVKLFGLKASLSPPLIWAACDCWIVGKVKNCDWFLACCGRGLCSRLTWTECSFRQTDTQK